MTEAAGSSVLPFVCAAVTAASAGFAADLAVERLGVSLTNVRRAAQSIALLGPAALMLALTMHPTQPVAEALFCGCTALGAFSAAGFGCSSQDIAGSKYSGLIYGATSAPALLVGAAGVQLVGILLDITDKDFTLMFQLTAAVDVAGALAYFAWWDSKRLFE